MRNEYDLDVDAILAIEAQAAPPAALRERDAVLTAIKRVRHRIGVEVAPTVNGQAAQRVRAWLNGILEAEVEQAYKVAALAAPATLPAIDAPVAPQEEYETVQTPSEALLETAWGIIANAGGGNWTLETEAWQKAVLRWRDQYHKYLADRPEAASAAYAEQGDAGERADKE